MPMPLLLPLSVLPCLLPGQDLHSGRWAAWRRPSRLGPQTPTCLTLQTRHLAVPSSPKDMSSSLPPSPFSLLSLLLVVRACWWYTSPTNFCIPSAREHASILCLQRILHALLLASLPPLCNCISFSLKHGISLSLPPGGVL